jgi:hypothetical protein
MNLEARVATLEETVAKQAAIIEALQRLLMPASSAPPEPPAQSASTTPPAPPAPLAKSNKKGLPKKMVGWKLSHGLVMLRRNPLKRIFVNMA